MKMKKLAVTLGAVLALGVVGTASAATEFGISDPLLKDPTVEVGPVTMTTTHHTGAKGDPGIATTATGLDKVISFSSLMVLAPADGNAIHAITDAIVHSVPGAPKTHNAMGVFSFTQVASNPVYFGEWSATGKVTDQSHRVYYIGADATTAASMPTGGTATYSVVGINQYNGSNLLKGNLQADFAQKTLNGRLDSVAGNFLTLTTNIDGAGFSGSATTNGASDGTASGHFFGAQASSLAGIAQFESDHTKDVAFGGSKQ